MLTTFDLVFPDFLIGRHFIPLFSQKLLMGFDSQEKLSSDGIQIFC